MLRRQAPEAARFTDQQPHRWPGVLQSCDDGTGTVNLSLGSMTKADEAVKMAAANRVGDQIAGCAPTSSRNCVKRRRIGTTRDSHVLAASRGLGLLEGAHDTV